MIKKSLIIGLFSISAAISVVAQKNVIDEVIWVVGDEAILRSDVEAERLYLQQTEGVRFEGDPYCFIPEQLAVQKLLLSQAKLDSIYAEESDVVREVDRWINANISAHGSKEKMEEYYNGQKLSQIREKQKVSMREHLTVNKMQKNIIGDIRLTPSDVRKYFNQISKDSLPMIPTMVEVEIITMEPEIPIEDIDAIKARLRDFTEQVNNGASFTTLAIRFSDDLRSAIQGGETGLLSKVQLAPEFATAAFSLNDPSRISNIVETEYGFHIIQLIEKRGDRINVRHILLRPKVSEQEINKAVTRLDSLLTAINDKKITFEEATYYSYDKDTRNNKGLMVNLSEESNNYGSPKFEMQELPQGMGVVIQNMEVGEISKPFAMKNNSDKDVVAIVRLKSRVNAHQANVSDDYQALKAIVENKKKEDIIRDWIVSKLKSTYVRIADGWRECDFVYQGWIKE